MSKRHAVFHITFLAGVPAGKKTVQAEEIILGRVEGCDLVVDHKDVSRKHLSVKTMYGQVIIEDLDSSNGTFVNGTEIQPKTPTVVGPGDVVGLGKNVTIQVHCEWTEIEPPSTGLPQEETTQPPQAPIPVPQPRRVDIAPPPPMPQVAPREVPQRQEPVSQKLELEAQKFDFDSPLPRAIKQNERLHQELIEARAEAKRILAGAQKQATTIVQEAERLAEVKTQGFYDRAKRTEAEAEELYKRRTEEAHRDAQKEYEETRAQVLQMVSEARAKAQEVRDQAEKFASELRAETHQKTQELLRAGEAQARELSLTRAKEAAEHLAKREEELEVEVFARLKAECDEIKAQMTRKLDLQEREASERLSRMERESQERVAASEARNKLLIQEGLDGQMRAEDLRRDVDRLTHDLDLKKKEIEVAAAELARTRYESKEVIALYEKSMAETSLVRSEILTIKEERDRELAESRRQKEEIEKEQEALLASKESERNAWLAAKEEQITQRLAAREREFNQVVAAKERETARILEELERSQARWIGDNEKKRADWTSVFEKQRSDWTSDFEKQKSEWTNDFDKRKIDWKNAYESEVAETTLRWKTLREEKEKEFSDWLANKQADQATFLVEDERKRKDSVAATERAISEASARLATLRKEVETFSIENMRLINDVEKARAESSASIKDIKSKYEMEKSKIEREEQLRFDQMKLETGRQIQKLEQDLLLEIQQNKLRLAREIVLVMETALSGRMPSNKIVEMQEGLQEQIAQVLQSPSSVSSGGNASKTQEALGRARRRNQMKQMATGFSLGAGVALVVVFVLQYMQGNLRPVERMIANAVEEKNADLAKRKFNPPQTDEVKDTYTDKVIYTRDYSAKFADSDYQVAYGKAASLHMLKTFQLGEDQTVRAVSRIAALVNALAEKKEKIHPDFVTKGVNQMRELEAQTLREITVDLGSKVRLEALQKFEREYFINNR